MSEKLKQHGARACSRVFVAVMLCGLFGAAAEPLGAGERQVLEGILVRVNDRIVTISDFRQRLLSEISQMPARPAGADLENYADNLFDVVVDELVLLERAEQKNLTVEDEVVDRAIQKLRDENNLQSAEDFERALAQAGLDEEGLRERYRQTMVQQRVVQSEVRPTEITEEEVRRVYDERLETYRVPEMVDLQQLFFEAAEGESVDEVTRRASGVVERVRAGADLKAEATLAGVELVDVGRIPLEDLRPERRRALASLAKGEISEPLVTAGGVLVLRLVERLPAGYRPFDEVKEEIRRQMSMEAYQAQSQGLVERLKSDFLVEVHPDRMAVVLQGLGDV